MVSASGNIQFSIVNTSTQTRLELGLIRSYQP